MEPTPWYLLHQFCTQVSEKNEYDITNHCENGKCQIVLEYKIKNEKEKA